MRDSTAIGPFTSLLRNRGLVIQLARREVAGRYRGSMLGLFWSFVNPVLMLVVYTFVFSVVFKSRWAEGDDPSQLGFAVTLFAGLIVFGIFAECATRAPQLVVSQPNYVKKVVFPLEVLPWVAMLAALFHAAISFLILILLLLFSRGSLPSTTLLLPLVVAPLVFWTMGLSWFLSALGVFLRDIGQVVGIAVTALMFLSPLFFPASALPERFGFLVAVNPVAFPIESARAVLVFGRAPSWEGLLGYTLLGVAVMWLGFSWFQRSRRAFADVI
jgi:lipopolysaccharide transport system permease protein